MKLISCHIENFGKLNNVDYTFDDKITEIIENNGFGKSTFAAFIKAMFYGFNTDGRSKLKKERERYIPWQGGKFGGTVVFSVNKKSYRVEREFGHDARGDKFKLYDAETNLPSDDFSAGQFGEEIFKIDSEAFMKTALLKESDCDTQMNSSMNTKMGVLEGFDNDMNNVDEALTLLDTEATRLVQKKGKNGVINKLETERSELSETIKVKDAVEEAIKKLTRRKEEARKEAEKLKNDLEELKKKRSNAAKYVQKKSAEEIYEKLVKNKDEREKKVKDSECTFGKSVPEISDVNTRIENEKKLEKLNNDVAALNKSINFSEYKAFENRFASGIPEDSEVKELSAALDDKKIRETEIRSKKINLDNARHEEDKKKESIEEYNRRLKIARILLVITGVLTLAGTLILYFCQAKKNYYTFLFAIIPLFIFVICLLLKNKKYEESPYISKLESDIKEDGEAVAKTNDMFKSFKTKYASLKLENEDVQELYGIKKDIERFKNLGISIAELKEAERKADGFGKATGNKEFLAEHNMAAVHVLDELIAMKGNLNELSQKKEEYDRAVKELTEFKDSDKYALVKDDTVFFEEITPEQLNNDITALETKIDENKITADEIASDLESRLETTEKISAAEDRLLEVNQEIDLLKKKHRNLLKANEFLEIAKINFTKEHTEPLFKSFSKCYRIVSGESPDDNFFLDANAGIHEIKQGVQRDIDSMSSGGRDLVGLCMRMSFIDRMYSDEKPFLLLDDPFVHFDNKRLEGGKRLLRYLANDYQIIFMSCHEEYRGILTSEDMIM